MISLKLAGGFEACSVFTREIADAETDERDGRGDAHDGGGVSQRAGKRFGGGWVRVDPKRGERADQWLGIGECAFELLPVALVSSVP